MEEIVSTEENFHAWCDKQEFFDNSGRNFFFSAKTYAYILKKVNEKNYLIPWNFASRLKIGEFLEAIYNKGFTYCMRGLYSSNSDGRYLRNFGFGCW